MFQVEVSKKVQKFLDSLNDDRHDLCVDCLKKLKENPFLKRPKCDIKKLSGREDVYRLRVGKYRFVYIVQEDLVIVEEAFHRERGYR